MRPLWTTSIPQHHPTPEYADILGLELAKNSVLSLSTTLLCVHEELLLACLLHINQKQTIDLDVIL